MEDFAGILVVASRDQLENLETRNVVVLNGDYGPLTTGQERELCEFVERGGGLVCTGDAIEAYHENELLGPLLGRVSGFCPPRCELVARVSEKDHYITRRSDEVFKVTEAAYLLDVAPEDGQILWQTSWHFVVKTLAYTRSYGRGQVFATTLGSASETQRVPAYRQMIERAIKYVGGAQLEERAARVAMVGYGAIGFEHGTAISHVAGLHLELVCDRSQERLQQARQAFPGVRTCTDLADVMDDPAVDVVILSTPPNTHASIAQQMLEANKHVVTEKPFCLTTREADETISMARERQRALTVYQCRRWDADFLAIKQVLKRGLIGPIFHMETFIGEYKHPCDYWHSHEAISGGVFYDWGSHYIDWILKLVSDPVVSVRGVAHKRVWHDVTNADQASVYIRFAQGQEAVFTHSDIAAALKPKWYILGEHGAIVGDWRYEAVKTRGWSGDLVEQRLAPSEALPDLKVYLREAEDVIHEQRLQLTPAPAYAFHRNLANHLHNGEPLAVPAEEARRNIAVMEAAKLSVERQGETIEVRC